jgi:FixJ family two-component response regulator
MSASGILIVDDEKNIRLTLSLALEPLHLPLETAASAEEALEILAANPYSFGLILLDLLMPGMGGMEFLRRMSADRPDLKVIIITAHGSIDAAVEAMKLGAVDFLQKPFNPAEIRALVTRASDLEGLAGQKARDYQTYVELALTRMREGQLDAARVYACKAISLDPTRPEAFNLLGGIFEVQGNRPDADKNYRAALTLDPTFRPAQQNLNRITSRPYKASGIAWGNRHQ